MRRSLCTLLVLVSGCACLAGASSATLLLEEPYGRMGFFTATGHAAVYLSGVCAETPLVLRPCAPGELGAVISRYDGVGGYDWVAIPLIPYLYAVEQPDDIPLFTDPKMVSFLREQYRRKHLEMVAPDRDNGEAPGGNWYELVGSAYDRAAYGFEIETTSAQDLAFIERYNSAPNRSHFHLSYRNCADFAKDVMNFYYPKSLRRSIVADVGITTPKQMAKTLIKFSGRHSELKFARFVIPQVPGSAARSTPVHGVVESFLKSKKYIVPAAVVNPIFAGCVLAVYEGTGAGRFDPARQALVFNPERALEPALGAEDRRSYQSELNHVMTNHVLTNHLVVSQLAADAGSADAGSETSGARVEKWGRLLHNAVPDLDAQGRLVLRIHVGEEVVSVGVSGSNIFANDAPGQFTQQLLEARLHAELRRGSPPKASESDVARDWNLLQKAMSDSDAEVALPYHRPAQPGSQARSERAGNRP
jgi:hypothetical protein